MEFKKTQSGGKQDTWVKKNLPTCPFCRNPPEWETATEFAMSVKRYYFRCSDCRAVFSAIASEVIPIPGPLSLATSRMTIVIRVENTGDKEESEHLAGKDLSLSELQEWARET